MKGRYWNKERNQPEPELIKFLDEKVTSTEKRIREATGVEVEVIFYAAGYKDGADAQHPYNLSKLLLHILVHTKPEKRVPYLPVLNPDPKVWDNDDGRGDYPPEIQKTFVDSVVQVASEGADIGGSLGRELAGWKGEVVGRSLGWVAGAAVGVLKGIFR